jgi:ATP-dependent RNA helicase RhlE
VIPVLQKLQSNPSAGVRCLILTPTRELANQIDEQVTVIGYYSGVSSATVFGGTDGSEFSIQERALKTEGANIIIATPGRLLDHIKMGYADFSKLEVLILDEADRMLDMGFLPDVQKIISKLPTQRQNILFSATIPDTLHRFFQSIVNDPVRVDCSVARTASGISQFMYRVTEETREEVLIDLVKQEDVTSAIVFTKTKRDADHLFKKLMKAEVAAGVIHGDREQDEREVTLDGFKSGKIRVLVATDVLARGIDVDEVSHVFNFQVPHEPEDYIHRIGRTARAEAKGTAVTLVSGKELRSWGRIKAHVKTPIEERFPAGHEPTNEVHDEQQTERKERGRNRPVKAKKAEISTTTVEHIKEMLASAPAPTANEDASKQYIRTSTTRRQVELAEKQKAELQHEKATATKPDQIVKEEKTTKPTEDRSHSRRKNGKRPSTTDDGKRGAVQPREQVVEKQDHNDKRSSRNRRKPKSERGEKNDRFETSKKNITLTKREDLQRRFEAVDNKPSLFSKIKKLFGFGK